MKPGLMATDSWETGAAQPECHNHTHTQKEGTVQAKRASSSPVKQTDGLIIKGHLKVPQERIHPLECKKWFNGRCTSSKQRILVKLSLEKC